MDYRENRYKIYNNNIDNQKCRINEVIFILIFKWIIKSDGKYTLYFRK